MRHSVSGKPIYDEQGRFKGYRGVGNDVTEAKCNEERIQYLAYHDGLTSLPNRVMFGRTLGHAVEQARRHNQRLAVLFIDLDRFKNINDTLGHEAGDMLLQETGRRLQHALRQSDAVARLGGDEFVVLLEEVDEPAIGRGAHATRGPPTRRSRVDGASARRRRRHPAVDAP